ncbi:MAG: lamin tail domain-containing protein, partial [Planctomycetales bacterium]|nr:lamin tail domain-containing protein [Planctomycetales bacterium]
MAFRHVVDDGAVFYLNGVEFGRFNLPSGDITYSTLASAAVGDAIYEGPIAIPPALLRQGTNTLAVELHQQFTFSPDVVFGAEVSALLEIEPATEFRESSEEWIELYNRGASAVDLSGWSLTDAVAFQIPENTIVNPGEYIVIARDAAQFAAQYPDVTPLGEFSGSLSDSGEQVTLRDAVGNVADEVHYFDGGRWPEYADGGGSSLELRNPAADNGSAEAWASSVEQSDWQHVSYTMTVDPIVHDPPINFHEFVMGLLSAGEILIDNISVLENPDGEPIELIQNGTFESDALNAPADKWRIQGTHGTSRVVADPDDPTNQVLHLRADARSSYLSNHAETTLANSARVTVGQTYQISSDAKWIGGSPQLHTELYYKDAARTTILQQPSQSGTPGAPNSTLVANLGPTYEQLQHQPVIPSSTDDVAIRVRAADPNGIDQLTLFYSVNGGAFTSVPMLADGAEYFTASIPAQANNRVVQFYVEGRDTANATSMFPSRGPESRALYKVIDNYAPDPSRHDFNILMTPADVNALHLTTNMMNNDRQGSTVIYDGHEVFYDVGTRLRGSMFTRQSAAATGYNVRFNADQLFRGVHETVAFDQNGEQEILAKFITTQSAHLGGTYDDVFRLSTPSGSGGGPTLAYLARHDDVFLEEQFENGTDGMLFKFEGIRV